MTAFGGGKGHRGMDLSCTVRAPGADASNQAQLPLLLLPDEADMSLKGCKLMP